jgi:hypothetical protein
MADLKELIRLEGRSDIKMYKDGDVIKVRRKRGFSKQRMKDDPVFARARENSKEFGAVAKAGKSFRRSLAVLITGKDRYMTSRLHKAMYQALKEDKANKHGERKVARGNPGLLNGFDFNLNAKLGTTLLVGYSASFNRGNGIAAITVPAFTPTMALSAPQGATHYKLKTGAVASDLEMPEDASQFEESALLPINDVPTSPVDLVVTLGPIRTLPVFQVLSVQFYQQVDGMECSVADGIFDALKVVNVVV